MLKLPQVRKELDEDTLASYIIEEECTLAAEGRKDQFLPQANQVFTKKGKPQFQQTSSHSPPTRAQQQQPKHGGGVGGGGEKWKGAKDGQSKGGKGGFKGNCYVCGQPGHIAKYCRQRVDKEADKGGEGSGGNSAIGKGVVSPSVMITDGQRLVTEQLQDESSMDGVQQSGGKETGEQQIGEQQIGEQQIGEEQIGEQQTGEPQTGEQEMWGIRDGGRVLISGTTTAPLRRSTRITRGVPPVNDMASGTPAVANIGAAGSSDCTACTTLGPLREARGGEGGDRGTRGLKLLSNFFPIFPCFDLRCYPVWVIGNDSRCHHCCCGQQRLHGLHCPGATG
ncbi:unnamed protein product [Closterium sp. Naga37s-1]|nr:unnamed protein product [Closterium sp. Naga37s-1]